MAPAINIRSCLKNVRLLELILSVFLIISIALAYAGGESGDLIFASGYDVNLALPGVVRKGRDSLTNETRESIIDFISKNPGCGLSHIIKKENLPRSTVRYHVAKLKSEGRVVFKCVGKSLRVFVSSHALSDKEKTVAVYAHNETDRTILYMMLESEGSTSRCLSDRLNMGKSVVYKHLKKYVENGIAWDGQDGRNKKYFLDKETKDILAKYRNSLKTNEELS